MAVRPPAVAGSFYPANPADLVRQVEAFLSAAPAAVLVRPRAIIVPHAGYVYSGAAAGQVYARLGPFAETYRRVILLGPCHRVWVPGIAIPAVDRFMTPLGVIPLDVPLLDRLADVPGVVRSDEAHREEHSLEVQLPFLQCLIRDFSLVPLAVGDAPANLVEMVLETLWDEDSLLVVSSDLSHFLPSAEARKRDRETADRILARDDALQGDQACGCRPINGLLRYARRHQWQVDEVVLVNSGDTAGDKQRVVGYGGFILH